jgi:hypothetical protein
VTVRVVARSLSPPRSTGSASAASLADRSNRRHVGVAVAPTTTTPPGFASVAINGPHSRSPRVETALHGVFAASTADSAGPVSGGGRTTRGSAAVVSANGDATSMPMRPVDSAGTRPWRRRGHVNRSNSSVGTSTGNSCSLPTSVASRWFRLGITNLAHHDDRGGFAS